MLDATLDMRYLHLCQHLIRDLSNRHHLYWQLRYLDDLLNLLLQSFRALVHANVVAIWAMSFDIIGARIAFHNVRQVILCWVDANLVQGSLEDLSANAVVKWNEELIVIWLVASRLANENVLNIDEPTDGANWIRITTTNNPKLAMILSD